MFSFIERHAERTKADQSQDDQTPTKGVATDDGGHDTFQNRQPGCHP